MGPREEQEFLLSTELSLQPLQIYFRKYIFINSDTNLLLLLFICVHDIHMWVDLQCWWLVVMGVSRWKAASRVEEYSVELK